ncbi:MAG: signal recognition particle-docking protein FtsY [Betaproteobacteria bacterium]|nr:MAG: signal recognition particle-docking protein FtsY [Betaproteobacteria bacterium]
MFGFLKKKRGTTGEAGTATPPPESIAADEVVAEPAAEGPAANVSASVDETGAASAAPDAALPSAPVSSPVAAAAEAASAPKRSWAERLKAGLARTRQQLGGGLASLFGRRKIDEDLLEELETTLLMADCGVEATQHLLGELRTRWKRDKLETADQLQQTLADALHAIIAPLEQPLDVSGHSPYIIMIAGVNGSGKTTSIGKLAKYFQAQGKSVLLAAGDTFRAAAREQLMTWGERNNVTVVAQEGGDAAAVIFDAINAARARRIDVVLADTAGRLPTQLHLMDEIAKVRRVIAKAEPSGPHEVILVLDANIGQNALAQVKAFDKAIGVTGLVVTKLDGTAKGGVLAAIARQCPKPLRFIGVGEGIDDLQPFKAREFVDALFEPVPGAVRSGAEAGRRA